MNRIINPSKPSETTAAVTLSEEENEPYLTILYTAHKGRITFFALEPTGSETMPVEQEGEDPRERLLYRRPDGSQTSNPDEAEVLISGVQENGQMDLDEHVGGTLLESPDQAVNYIQAIRYVYSMSMEGASQ